MSALSTLTRTEYRLFLRDPATSFFVIAFPVILIVILGSIPSFREPNEELDGVRVIDLYVPIAVVFVLAMVGLSALPTYLATYREKGILRRLSTTPVHPGLVLAAQGIVMLVTAVATAAVVAVVGTVAFDVPAPGQPVGFLLAFVLAAGSLLSVGLFVAAVAPSGRAASGIGSLLFFPLMFFAGLWAPREAMPNLLVRIGDATPLGAAVQAMRDASDGSWPQPLHLGVMIAYVVVFGAAAARLFRWE